MTATAADLERNQIHRDIEARCLTALVQADIPLTSSQVAKKARVNTHQARRALAQLVADRRVRKIWDDKRDVDAYEPAAA
jgi:predicted ArsR family transcriptional regulator